jgi:hypothetical protein
MIRIHFWRLQYKHYVTYFVKFTPLFLSRPIRNPKQSVLEEHTLYSHFENYIPNHRKRKHFLSIELSQFCPKVNLSKSDCVSTAQWKNLFAYWSCH